MSIPGSWHHCGIAVSDLNAAVTWYTDKLGFTIEKRFRLPDARLDIVNLISPTGARIELLQRDDAPAASDSARDLQAPGAMHLCFEVDDVEATAADLEARGVPLMQEPKIIAPAAVKNCWITDPEGNPIEFIQPLDTTQHT